MSGKEKEAKIEYGRNRYKNMKERNINFLFNIKMSEKTLKFGDAIVNEKEFHASKQAIG